MVKLIWRVVWRFASTIAMELYVAIIGMNLMLKSPADNWDIHPVVRCSQVKICL